MEILCQCEHHVSDEEDQENIKKGLGSGWTRRSKGSSAYRLCPKEISEDDARDHWQCSVCLAINCVLCFSGQCFGCSRQLPFGQLQQCRSCQRFSDLPLKQQCQWCDAQFCHECLIDPLEEDCGFDTPLGFQCNACHRMSIRS